MLHFEILVKEVIEKQINSCIHHLYRELDIKVQSFLLQEKEANRCKKNSELVTFQFSQDATFVLGNTSSV